MSENDRNSTVVDLAYQTRFSIGRGIETRVPLWVHWSECKLDHSKLLTGGEERLSKPLGRHSSQSAAYNAESEDSCPRCGLLTTIQPNRLTLVSFMRQPTSDKGHTGHTCRRQVCLQGGPCKPRTHVIDKDSRQRNIGAVK